LLVCFQSEHDHANINSIFNYFNFNDEDADAGIINFSLTQTATVCAGQQYQLTFWARAVNFEDFSSPCDINICVGNVCSTQGIDQFDDSYKQFTQLGPVASAATALTISVSASGNQCDTSMLFFDDFALLPI